MDPMQNPQPPMDPQAQMAGPPGVDPQVQQMIAALSGMTPPSAGQPPAMSPMAQHPMAAAGQQASMGNGDGGMMSALMQQAPSMAPPPAPIY